MDPNAEATFSQELGGFNLVAMAEGSHVAGEDPAQAVMAAELGAAEFTAVETQANAPVVFEQLDDRRKNVVSPCGSGACGGCVQKCGAYNPEDDSGEDFDLVEKATGLTKSGDDDSGFRSKIRFSAEEAQKRMAERKATNAAEAQSKTADRPTPQQRDQIVEIRKTAADPEMVRENLTRGHARMAERQKEREDRMAEQAKQEGDINNPVVSTAKKDRIKVSGDQQARDEERSSPPPAESESAKQSVKAIKAPTPKPKTEETTAVAQIKYPERTGDGTSQSPSDELVAQRHAEQIHAQTASAQSSDESMAQSKQVISERSRADQPDAGDDPAIDDKQRTPVTQAEEPRELGTRPDDETSYSEFIDVNEGASRPEHGADLAQIEENEAGDNETLVGQTETDYETGGAMHFVDEPEFTESDPEPVVSSADSNVVSDSLVGAEADVIDDNEMTPDGVVPDQGVDVEAPGDSDVSTLRAELDEADKVPEFANAEIEDEPRAMTAPPGEDIAMIGSSEFELTQVEETDEAEADDELLPETFDYVIIYNQEPVKKYSRGSAKKDDAWKPNSNNRGKKSVPQTFRRVRSSGPVVFKGKRNRKKLLKLLANLGQFVTDNFNKPQPGVNEGVEA